MLRRLAMLLRLRWQGLGHSWGTLATHPTCLLLLLLQLLCALQPAASHGRAACCCCDRCSCCMRTLGLGAC
jgi:hypothetical protein